MYWPVAVWHVLKAVPRCAQTEAIIRAAGELRKQQVLDLAGAPWAPAQLLTYLPVTPSQTLSIEEADSHAHVDQLAVRPCRPLYQMDFF